MPALGNVIKWQPIYSFKSDKHLLVHVYRLDDFGGIFRGGFVKKVEKQRQLRLHFYSSSAGFITV
jgi:hypothetical protein